MQEKLTNKQFLNFEANKQLMMAKDCPKLAHLRKRKIIAKQQIKVVCKNALLIFGLG
jgi:hypothetical protein